SSAVLVLAVSFAALSFAHHVKKSDSKELPVTTSSAKARQLYKKGMDDYENLYLERCNEDWRAAVKEDPDLAVAWAWIAFNSGNPVEVGAAGEKAKALLPQVTPGEKLMIEWTANVPEGKHIAGAVAISSAMS